MKVYIMQFQALLMLIVLVSYFQSLHLVIKTDTVIVYRMNLTLICFISR